MIIIEQSTINAPETRNNVVYLISRIDTGEVVYVGKTVNITRRIREHLNVNGWEKHKFNALYSAFKKYGVETFKFEIFACFEAEQDAFNMEIKLISTKKPKYNILPGGGVGTVATEIWQQWLEGTQKEFKPIKGYNLKTNEVFSFSSYNEAAKYTGVHNRSISQIVDENSGRVSSNSWVFSCSENPDWSALAKKANSAKDVHKKRIQGTNIKTGEVSYFESTMDAFRETNTDQSSISKVCRGKLKTANGYHWQYA